MNNFTEEAYSNNGKKLCVVFEQVNFLGKKKRVGNEKDHEKIKECFKEKLEYKFQVYKDLEQKGFAKCVDKVKEICINENIECLVVFILSHGNRKCILTADNEEMTIYEDIVKKFTAIDDKFMKGKPKLFVFQSCRGTNHIPGNFEIDDDFDEVPNNNHKQTAIDSDILIAYATLPGTVAFRDANYGTPFIYYLCQIFGAFYKLYDVVTMLTMVNQLMAENITINATHEINGKEQSINIKLMSCFKSQLTKRMYLSAVPANFLESPIAKGEPFTFKDIFSSITLSISGPKMDDIKQGRLCLIINQNEFLNNAWKEGWRRLEDTDIDAIRLEKVFKKLDFKVLIKTNLCNYQIEKIIELIEKDGIEMEKVKCLVVIMLTNGEGDQMKANGSVITIQHLKKPFVDCDKIAQIPKMFFVQACGGGKQGENADEDENGTKYEKLKLKAYVTSKKGIPVEANSLIAYSSCPDRGNGQGTKFVEELCKVIKQNHSNCDIVSLLTLVNRKLSEELQCKNIQFCLPCWFVSRLTGEVFLTGDRGTQYSELSPNIEELTHIDTRNIEGPSSEYDKQEHLIILVFNNIDNYDSAAQNHGLNIMSDLFHSLNFKCHVMINMTNVEFISECLNIKHTYEEKCFKSIWIMFICPAIEYGPVAYDDRCINIKNIVSTIKLGNVAKITNVIIFATPHGESKNIEHDAREIDEPTNTSKLKDLEFSRKFDQMVNLHDGLKLQTLDGLDLKINYYMLSVPFTIDVDDNELYVNIFIDYIKSSFDKKQTVGWAFKSINNKLIEMKWPTELLPVFHIDNDFVI